ncbi:hypothetical protein SAMN05519104_4710 [Rhizobiales bacterium GAS188]|nr:hypothetical protein SAMN05519104_4710 [Rhizobiales bacterium GAS188]
MRALLKRLTDHPQLPLAAQGSLPIGAAAIHPHPSSLRSDTLYPWRV